MLKTDIAVLNGGVRYGFCEECAHYQQLAHVDDYQSTKLLKAGYEAIFKRPLLARVDEIINGYAPNSQVSTELGALAYTHADRYALREALIKFEAEQ
jgi:hypothetical protein